MPRRRGAGVRNGTFWLLTPRVSHLANATSVSLRAASSATSEAASRRPAADPDDGGQVINGESKNVPRYVTEAAASAAASVSHAQTAANGIGQVHHGHQSPARGFSLSRLMMPRYSLGDGGGDAPPAKQLTGDLAVIDA